MTTELELSEHPDRRCRPPESWTSAIDIRMWADQWFPRHETVAAGKELCGGCPIATRCLTYALDNELEGIWGGTTTKQRADARKKKEVAA